MSPPDDGPGILVQCGFGNEERAVGEVRASLGDRWATTRGAVSHKGLGFLALDDAAAADATSAFAALVGAPTPACPTPPDPAVLRNCQALFPVSRACAADAASVRAATRAEATRAIASGAVPALARPDARVAVAVHTRGDDSHASRDNGAPPLARADVLAAALAGLADARADAHLPPPVAHLHAPDVVVLVAQWRRPVLADAAAAAAAGRFVNPPGANAPTCGVAILPRTLCDVRSKGIFPAKITTKAKTAAADGGDAKRADAKRRERDDARGADVRGADVRGAERADPAAREGSHRSDRARAAKTAKPSAAAAPGYVSKNAAAAPPRMDPAAADAALDAAVARRRDAGLLPLEGEEVGGDDGRGCAVSYSGDVSSSRADGDARVSRALRDGVALRLVNGTGDGFDGLTLDALGGALLLEQHRRWAPHEPLLDAIARRSFGRDATVYLKRRWSGDPVERGGALVRGPPVGNVAETTRGLRRETVETIRDDDETETTETTGTTGTTELAASSCTRGASVIAREPGPGSLAFGLWLTGEEHVGVFLDSRPTRDRVREISAGRRVLNLFAYTGGFGVAAAAGGAACAHNVDSKAPCLAAARANYALNGLPVDPDGRSFRKADAIRFLARTAETPGTRYDVIVCDPPPRFSRKSDWAFEAELHTGLLLAACVGVAAPRGAVLIAGLNALTVSDERFREMIDEAATLSGRTLEIARWIGAGPDFPKCPYRPTARFAEINVGDAREGAETTLADELAARDEGGDDDDPSREEDDEFDTDQDRRDTSTGEEKEKESETDETEAKTETETNGGDVGTTGRAGDGSAASAASARGAFACELCGSPHASRNRLFRHFRDVRTECGAWIARQGGVAEATARIARGEVVSPTFAPPDASRWNDGGDRGARKRKKKKKIRGLGAGSEAGDESGTGTGSGSATGAAWWSARPRGTRATRPDELWIGGVPSSHATLRRVGQLLWSAIPGSAGVQQPTVAAVVRKGWRDKKTKEWIGYAFARFRDAEEASLAMRLLNGATPEPGITLRAAPSTSRAADESTRKTDATDATEATEAMDAMDEDGVSIARVVAPCAVGADPPLAATLAAWPARTLARRAAAAGYASTEAYLAATTTTTTTAASDANTSSSSSDVRAALEEPSKPHVYVHVTGAEIPRALADRLLASLRDARWPSKTHRKAVDSERYLVLSSDVAPPPAVDPYDAIKTAARAVMQWADPSFPYDHLAVTRGFLGSPHVDREDVTHQYAAALGEYGEGGELVVESEDGGTRWVVDTRGKMARFDGRFAHWVRGYDRAEGVRFSVVWYANKPSAATARSFAVDAAFQGGAGGSGGGAGGRAGARARRWGMRAVVGLSGLALTVGVVGAARRRGERRRR